MVYNGKPYEQMDYLGGGFTHPYFWFNTRIIPFSTWLITMDDLGGKHHYFWKHPHL